MWRIAAVLAALLAVGGGALAARGAGGGKPAAACGRVDRGVLPAWARTGFSDPEPRLAHVVGASGRIVAILFGDPLTSPPSPERGNKILWASNVAQSGPSDLRISAVGPGGRRVTRVVAGGPGPSGIDLPAAGCWRLTLRWAGHRDTLSLRYAQGRPSQAAGGPSTQSG